MRFALGVDDDLSDFYRRFRREPLLGPLLRRRPHLRPRRRPWPWEALAWAVTNQLIEAVRAARIQRRIVRRWGPRLGEGPATLRDVPCAAVIAGRAPAELESTDLAARRAIALREVARDVAGGRCDPSDPASDARLLARRNIGPWTVQCLGLHGRGDPDSLPAGDLAYLKLVGRLAGLGGRGRRSPRSRSSTRRMSPTAAWRACTRSSASTTSSPGAGRSASPPRPAPASRRWGCSDRPCSGRIADKAPGRNADGFGWKTSLPGSGAGRPSSWPSSST